VSTNHQPILCVICRKPARREDRVRTRKGGHTHRACLDKATKAGHAGASTPPAGQRPERPAPAAVQWDAPEQRRGPGTPSRFPGKCPMCDEGYPAKTLVTKIFAGWAHTLCVFPDSAAPSSAGAREFEENRAAILSGETFRSQKPSTWRRGGSPSSSGGARR
jgi:hypothetical protein